MLRNRRMAVVLTASVAVILGISLVFTNFDDLKAYAGITLENENVAKSIIVRVNPIGTNIEKSFDSFSRIGFVSGESNFLLESVPSKDKKPYYSLIKRSLETDNPLNTIDHMNISIDVYSGDGEIIESLLYKDCNVKEYFVHGIDSRGKIFFVENQGNVEIREVTKFECTSFTLDIDYTEEEIIQIQETIEYIDRNPFELEDEDAFFSKQFNGTEGDLFYNSMTNRLQQFVNGEWVDISGVGGPPSPRR